MSTPLTLPIVFGSLTGSGPLSNLDLDFNAIKTYLDPPAGFNNLSPMANVGDLIVGDTLGAATVLPSGEAETVLTSSGIGSSLSWSPVPNAPANSVNLPALKVLTNFVQTATSDAMLVLPGAQYGFYPQVKNNMTDRWVTCTIGSSYINQGSQYVGTDYQTYIGIASSGGTSYVQQTYMTASGEVIWVFIQRNKDTKEALSAALFHDHPCFCNGGDPVKVAHPFPMYNPETEEIVVVTLSKEQMDEIGDKGWVGDVQERDPLQVITEDYEVDEDSRPEWPTIPVTVAVGTRKNKSEIVKKVIPKPDYILCRSLKLGKGVY